MLLVLKKEAAKKAQVATKKAKKAKMVAIVLMN